MLFNGHLAPRILIDYSLPPGSSTLHSPPHPRQVSLLNDCRRQSASRLFIIGSYFRRFSSHSRCWAFERALMGAPRLTHQKIGVGALARRILLNPAVSYRRGVEASLRIRDEPMYTPHAALARTKRTPRIEEMSVFVISVQLVRSLIRSP